MLLLQLFTWIASGENTSITANSRLMGVVMEQNLSALEKASFLYFCDKYKYVFYMTGMHLTHLMCVKLGNTSSFAWSAIAC